MSVSLSHRPVLHRALVLMSLILCTGAQAQQAAGSDRASTDPDLPPVYRVELVAFAHIDGRSDRLPRTRPADFTGLLDPLLLTRAHQVAASAADALERRLAFAPTDPTNARPEPYLASDDARVEPIPPAFADLGGLSPTMQRTLDRLRGSAAHEVLLSRSWTQTAERGRNTPRLRLHDRSVVATLAPGRAVAPPWFPVELRVPVEVSEDGRVRFQRLFRPRPPRLEVYRVDGSARLRRRQFLHLELDLVWQQRDPGLLGSERRMVAPTVAPESSPTTPEAEPRDWLVHRMTQSRVIEPGRLEYFDSSRFGVLVLVHRFEQVVPEPEPELEPMPGPAQGPGVEGDSATEEQARSTPGQA